MPTIGSKLRAFGLEKFKNINKFALALDMKPPGLYNYLNDVSKPGTEILQKLMKLGCDIEWLLGDDSDLPFQEQEPPPSLVSSTRPMPLEFQIVANIPAGNADFFDRSDWYNSETINFNPEQYFFLQIDQDNGESMKPLLKAGDLCLCSRNAKDKPRNGDLVAANWGEKKGAVKLYNYSELKDLVSLYSYNQAFDPLIFKPDEVKLYRIMLIIKK